MNKSELRKIYKEKRKALSPDKVLFLSENITKNFILKFKPFTNQKIHIFLSSSKLREVNTNSLINYFFDNKVRVFVPKVLGEKMTSVEIFKETVFEENKFGILEPKEHTLTTENYFDFVITPLLYCDRSGNRVGYGKGFYDGFFSNINQDCKKIGVNFFKPNVNIDDVSSDDVPLDYLVLPTEVLSFGFPSKFTK